MTAPAVSRRAASLPLALATAAAALAGAAIGIALAPRAGERAPERAPRVGLASGVARLPLPAGWAPLGRRSTLPGLEAATAVRSVHGEAALDIRAPEHPSLLPASVARALGGRPPAPEPRRLGAGTAWEYALGEPRPGIRAVALALPTTGGVVTIACAAPPALLERAAAECERAAGALRLDGASALVPAPETAAAIVLPGAIARLNRVRTGARDRLAATRSPPARGAAAARLARAYAALGARLRPLAAGDALALTATVDALAREHRALASASRRRAARRAALAGAAIARGETRLAAQLARLTRRSPRP